MEDNHESSFGIPLGYVDKNDDIEPVSKATVENQAIAPGDIGATPSFINTEKEEQDAMFGVVPDAMGFFSEKDCAHIKVNRKKAIALMEKWFLSYIVDIPIRNFCLAYFDNYVPDRFFVMPPSTTGKYHPKDLHRPGGLVLHTFRACHFFASIRKGCKMDMDISNYYWASLCLHDTEKNGKGWGLDAGDASLHPQRAATKILSKGLQTGLQPSKAELLSELVLNHMGCFTKKDKIIVGGRPLAPTPWLEFSNRLFMMYICDLMASSKTTMTSYDHLECTWLSV